jgi:hypothetical protein
MGVRSMCRVGYGIRFPGVEYRRELEDLMGLEILFLGGDGEDPAVIVYAHRDDLMYGRDRVVPVTEVRKIGEGIDITAARENLATYCENQGLRGLNPPGSSSAS